MPLIRVMSANIAVSACLGVMPLVPSAASSTGAITTAGAMSTTRTVSTAGTVSGARAMSATRAMAIITGSRGIARTCRCTRSTRWYAA